MTAILGSKSCRNCAHRHKDGQQLFCRRHPPLAHPIVVMTPSGPHIAAWTANFPPVSPDIRCGEHSYVAIYDEAEALAGQSNGKVIQHG